MTETPLSGTVASDEARITGRRLPGPVRKLYNSFSILNSAIAQPYLKVKPHSKVVS